MPIRQYLRVDFDEIDGILGFSEKKTCEKTCLKRYIEIGFVEIVPFFLQDD